MEIQELLGGIAQCSCGRAHVCPIEHVAIGAGVLSSLPALTAAYRHILLVADEHTYRAAGQQVDTLLHAQIADRQIYQTGDEVLVPNEEAIAAIQAHLTADTDLVLGVGSGVINDLCKHVSHQAGLPYYSVMNFLMVATAAG